MKGKTRFTRREGSNLVEFALTLPLLALLLFAIIQYGFLFAAHITLRNAASVGARAAVISTNNNSPALLAKAACGPMLDSTKANAVLGQTNVAGAQAWTMTVSYDVPLIIPFVVPGGGSTKTLTAVTIAR